VADQAAAVATAKLANDAATHAAAAAAQAALVAGAAQDPSPGAVAVGPMAAVQQTAA
jgi:hypothetical protein